MKPFFEVVVTSTQRFREPHAKALRDSNEGLAIHSNILPTLEDRPARNHAWRNCDRYLRAWWDRYRQTVATDHVLFLEGDVYVNCDLTELFHGPWMECDLVAAGLRYQVRDRRTWFGFREMDRLPVAMTDAAIGVEPLAVMMLSRRALDRLLWTDYDAVFNDDIFCELRLPTCVQHAGGEVGFHPRLHDVGCLPTLPRRGERGIWHPVKTEVAP